MHQVDYEVGDSLRRVLADRQFGNCTSVDDDYIREYPHGELCANIVGFTGDTCGWRPGVRIRFRTARSGGWVQLQKDAIGRTFPYPSFPVKRPVAGMDIDLTLDLDAQQICYDALERRVKECSASAAPR